MEADMLNTVLAALTLHGNRWSIVDEMHHTAGPGRSRVERWPLTGCGNPHSAPNANTKGPWVWRVMWRPDRYTPYTRVAFGVEMGQRDAQLAGRRAATANAKFQREAA